MTTAPPIPIEAHCALDFLCFAKLAIDCNAMVVYFSHDKCLNKLELIVRSSMGSPCQTFQTFARFAFRGLLAQQTIESFQSRLGGDLFVSNCCPEQLSPPKVRQTRPFGANPGEPTHYFSIEPELSPADFGRFIRYAFNLRQIFDTTNHPQRDFGQALLRHLELVALEQAIAGPPPESIRMQPRL